MQSFSKKEAFRFGWNTFKKEPWLFIGLTLFVFVVSALPSSLIESETALGFLATVVLILVEWWLYLGLTRITLAAYAGSPISFKMLFGESWDTLYRFAVAAIVTGILTVVGLVLLIVPGIIVHLMLSMVIFAVVEKGMGPIESLKESKRLTSGHKWNLFWFVILLALLNVLGVMLIGVGLLVTVPVTFLAMVYAYKALDRRDDVAPVAPIAMPAAAPAAPMAPKF